MQLIVIAWGISIISLYVYHYFLSAHVTNETTRVLIYAVLIGAFSLVILMVAAMFFRVIVMGLPPLP
ncbi:hypothetical protein [Hyphobacterium sp.]|uniref:hypothetical protein n=1 Tax=Hyphobacterium sp. TaxID=2004662 RepID=UPI003BAD346A